MDSGNRLTMLRVELTAALTYKTGIARGDCRGQMNAANFDKWAVEKTDSQSSRSVHNCP